MQDVPKRAGARNEGDPSGRSPPRGPRAARTDKAVRPASSSAPGRTAWGATFLEGALGWLVAALPFGIALSRAASTGQWRDDLPVVRDLGLVSVGVGGGLSTVVAQTLSLLPLGSRTFRTSVGAAIALGLAAHLTYLLALRVLRATLPPAIPPRPAQPASVDAARRGAPAASEYSENTLRPTSRLLALVAAIAALTASLSPAWQLEGTVGGGAMWATCAVLAAVSVALSFAERPEGSVGDAPGRARNGGVRPWLLLGGLTGAAFAERPVAGICAAAATAIVLLVPRLQTALLDGADRLAARLLRRRADPAHALVSPTPFARDSLLAAAGAAIFTGMLLLSPVVLRPLAPRAWADLGHFLSTTSVAALDTPVPETSALSAWGREVGVLSLAIAFGGALLGLLRPRTRAPIAALLVLVALDTLLPARLASFLTADPFAPLRCVSIAALAVGSAFGVHEITVTLRRSRVRFAKPASVLVVTFHVTLIALTSEEAALASDRDIHVAAEVWTDEALESLPHRSAVLVRSPAIAWRLWAARSVRGERPDVLVIPAPLLGRGRVTEVLLSNERAMSLLLRDMALTGSPSEHALSTLADARPLFVELFPGWPQRLFRHLSVNGLWLGYTPEPRGPSDRKLALLAQAAPLSRVLRAVGEASQADPSTGAIVAESLKGQAALLIALGETETAQTFLMKVAALTPKKNGVTTGITRASAPVGAAAGAAAGDKRSR